MAIQADGAKVSHQMGDVCLRSGCVESQGFSLRGSAFPTSAPVQVRSTTLFPAWSRLVPRVFRALCFGCFSESSRRSVRHAGSGKRRHRGFPVARPPQDLIARIHPLPATPPANTFGQRLRPPSRSSLAQQPCCQVRPLRTASGSRSSSFSSLLPPCDRLRICCNG